MAKERNDKTKKRPLLRDHQITVTLKVADFVASVGREPHDQREFDTWGRLWQQEFLCGVFMDWETLGEFAANVLAKWQQGSGAQTTGAASDA